MLYKLTDLSMQTCNGFQWILGVPSPRLSGKGGLCSPAYYHAYRDAELAVVFNLAHGNFRNPRLFEARGRVCLDDGTKVGCRTLTLLREMEVPFVNLETRIAFAVLCAKEVYTERRWTDWADSWLATKGHSAGVTQAAWAKWTAEQATWAEREAERAAAWAARAASWTGVLRVEAAAEAATAAAETAAAAAEAMRAAEAAAAAKWTARTMLERFLRLLEEAKEVVK
jgi:hypothetical protein